MKDYAYLINGVVTREEADELVEQLQELMHAVHVKGGKVVDKLQKGLPESVARRLVTLAERRGVDLTDRKEAREVLRAAQLYIMELPVLILTVAVVVSGKLVADIKEYLASRGVPLQVDIQVDAGLVGGVMVGWRGKLYDYSLRKKLDEIKF